MKKLVPIFVLIVVMLQAFSPLAYADGVQGDLSRAQNFLEAQKVLESGGENADWYAVLLCAAGQKDKLSAYAATVCERIESGVLPNDKMRTALVCRLMGIENDFVEAVLADNSTERISDIIWKLVIAVDRKTTELTQELADKLEQMSLEGGGFAISGKLSDPDMTAMAICALALSGRETEIHLSALSDLQKDSGGFETFGAENAESAAQALIALNFCGIDAKKDERFLKNGAGIEDSLNSFLTDSGGYSHIKGSSANVKATLQAALARLSCEKGKELYAYDGVAVTPYSGIEKEAPREPVSYKIIVIAVSFAAALTAVAVLFAARRANAKNLSRVALGLIVVVAVTLLTNIQTKEQFYAENPDPIGENSRVVSISATGDGVLIPPTDYALRDGENALELILRVAKYNGLRVDFSGGYVRGIGGLYEFDRGAGSGWKIKINGEFPYVGADMIFPQDGDTVEWIYGNW